jgi:hypothetical protein
MPSGMRAGLVWRLRAKQDSIPVSRQAGRYERPESLITAAQYDDRSRPIADIRTGFLHLLTY